MQTLKITLTGKDAEQAFAELVSNVQYDNLDCQITLNGNRIHTNSDLDAQNAPTAPQSGKENV